MNCSICEAASACQNRLMGILCCIILGGPVMIIVGIVMLVTPNTRAERVARYNQAVKSFDSSGIANQWAQSGSTIGNLPVQFATESVSMVSDQEAVDYSGTSHYVYNVQQPFANVPDTQTVNVTSVVPFTRTLSKSVQMTVSIYCPSSSSSSSSRNSGCSSSSMSSRCSSQYGGSYSGGSCSSGSSCGSCTFWRFLATYCMVVMRSSTPNEWVESSTYLSCYYPFSLATQHYLPSSSSVTLKLLDSKDPYLSMQQETQGTGDFGITAEMQRAIGITLTVLGSVCTVCLGAALCVIAKMIMSASQVSDVKTDQEAPVIGQIAPYTGGSGEGGQANVLPTQPCEGGEPQWAYPQDPSPWTTTAQPSAAPNSYGLPPPASSNNAASHFAVPASGPQPPPPPPGVGGGFYASGYQGTATHFYYGGGGGGAAGAAVAEPQSLGYGNSSPHPLQPQQQQPYSGQSLY